MLAQTGVAGQPASYFYRPSLQDWMNRLEIQKSDGAERDLIGAILQAAIVKGRGATPIFGLRQQWPSFGFLCDKLAVMSPEATTDRDRIAAAFGETFFIHLTREDKLEQAVSLIKARQSGLWHVAKDGSELERTAPDQRPQYDADEISKCIETLQEYKSGWLSWFKQERITPLRITYDELAQAPTKKMSDRVSRDWVARYTAHSAQT